MKEKGVRISPGDHTVMSMTLTQVKLTFRAVVYAIVI